MRAAARLLLRALAVRPTGSPAQAAPLPRMVLNALTALSRCSDEYSIVMDDVWDTLGQPGRNWRKIFKVGPRWELRVHSP